MQGNSKKMVSGLPYEYQNPQWKVKKPRTDKLRKVKELRVFKVLSKCSKRPEKESLAACKEIEALILVQTWNAQRKANLEHPIFVKLLLRSHVSGSFNLPVPTTFCKSYLPREDTVIVLETESGEQYDVKYLQIEKETWYHQLTGGWRRFVIRNKLVAGDVLIFQLVEASKFKVYFRRANSLTVRVPRPPLDLDTYSKENTAKITDADNSQIIPYETKGVHSVESFSNIESIEDFKTVIKEFLQNQELPESILCAYYELCLGQNALLHIGINHGLCTGTAKTVICQTVGIARALRTCDLSNFMDKFADWDKTLKAYERLGMNVNFIHARLLHLQDLAFSSEVAENICRLREASHERIRVEDEARELVFTIASLRKMSADLALEVETLKSKAAWGEFMVACSRLVRTKDEIKTLEVVHAELDSLFKRYDGEIETLKLKAKKHDALFQEEVSAPW